MRDDYQKGVRAAAAAVLNMNQTGVTMGELEGRKAAVDAIAALPGAGDVFGWVSIEGWPLADLKALFAADGTFDLDPVREA